MAAKHVFIHKDEKKTNASSDRCSSKGRDFSFYSFLDDTFLHLRVAVTREIIINLPPFIWGSSSKEEEDTTGHEDLPRMMKRSSTKKTWRLHKSIENGNELPWLFFSYIILSQLHHHSHFISIGKRIRNSFFFKVWNCPTQKKTNRKPSTFQEEKIVFIYLWAASDV